MYRHAPEEGDEGMFVPLRSKHLYDEYVRFEVAWADHLDALREQDSPPLMRHVMDHGRFNLWITMAHPADVKEAFRKWGRSPAEYVRYLQTQEWGA